MLTEIKCKTAACPPDKKRVRLTDGAGLYLEIAATGSRRWFWKFYGDGKESRLALGAYPDIGLRAARDARDDARRQHRAGTNPAHQRRAAKLAARASAAHTFDAIARELHTSRTGSGAWGAAHGADWLRACERDLFPNLGALPVDSITAPLLLVPLRQVEARGALRTAHDLREFAGQVFRYAVATGRATGNPAEALRDALAPHTQRHMAAVLTPTEAGELMRSLLGYRGSPATRAALLLSAYTFQRPGNIRAAEWAEFDLDAALWSIPPDKMKRRLAGKINGRPHRVPLARQCVAVLRELHPRTGAGRYLFPSLLTGERCMSDNTIRGALRRLGYANDEMTAHGFRAMARTLIAEHLPGIAADVVEAQLAHGKAGPLGAAYDRADYMGQRVAMMQAWGDYLDRLAAA